MLSNLDFWSVFGSLTGFAALILHFWRYLQEKPKIHLYIPSNEQSKIFLGFPIDYSRQNAYGEFVEDKSKCIFYIWARISNQSEKPITLLEIQFVFQNVSLVLDSQSHCSGFIPIDNRSSRSMTPRIQPVLTLEPYAAVEGYLCFGPSSVIPSDGTEAKIIIKTTRKTFKVKHIIRIDRFNEELFEIGQ